MFFDRITDEINTHKVTANNVKGAFDATQHLINKGFTRIAHITNSPEPFNYQGKVTGLPGMH